MIVDMKKSFFDMGKPVFHMKHETKLFYFPSFSFGIHFLV